MQIRLSQSADPMIGQLSLSVAVVCESKAVFVKK
jgi:hypothetical protein